MGGWVVSFEKCEFGYVQVKVCVEGLLLKDIIDYLIGIGDLLFDVWMSYGDKVVVMLDGFELLVFIESVLIVVM